MSICARACSKSTFFSGGVRLLGMVACCSGYSSIHNPDCSDYFEYYATRGLDFGSDSYYPHTDPVAVADSD